MRLKTIISVLFFLMFFLFVEMASVYQYQNLDSSKKYDLVIVLTGDHGRIEEGLKYWNGENFLYLSGVGQNFSAKNLKEFGVSEDKLNLPTLEMDRTENTFENLRVFKKWISAKEKDGKKINEVLIVTSSYHVRRSMGLADRFGLKAEFKGVGAIHRKNWPASISGIRITFLEWIKSRTQSILNAMDA